MIKEWLSHMKIKMALLQQNVLKTQLQSARNSLLFMETEHAKTLKGLHSEIQHLQKKCSELTFDLAMKDAVSGTTISSAEVDFKTEIKRLEEEAVLAAQEKVCLLRQIENQDRKIMEMEKQSDFNDRKFINEIKSKKFHISNLMNELETRATTIQYLTTQLHQTRAKLHSMQHKNPARSPHPPPSNSRGSPSRNYIRSQSVSNRQAMSPAPPTCPKSPTQRRKSRTRKSGGHSRSSTPLHTIPPPATSRSRDCASAPPRSPYVDGYLGPLTTYSYDSALDSSKIDTSPYLTTTPDDDVQPDTWGKQIIPQRVLPPIQSRHHHHRSEELLLDEHELSLHYATTPSSGGEERLAVTPVTMTTTDHTMTTSGRHMS